MKQFRIYYMKPEHFTTYIFGDNLPTKAKLAETHVEIRTILADQLLHVFWLMQAERWSPHGEASELIKSKGVAHTSMCVGDVAQDIDGDTFHVCLPIGFKEIS